eukprot:SAG31_NODE_3866_length_3801_cov_2.237979_3_plen_58_part_00
MRLFGVMFGAMAVGAGSDPRWNHNHEIVATASKEVLRYTLVAQLLLSAWHECKEIVK